MIVVGLTGGVGSGKTTVGAMLARRGAVVVDADAIARDALRPGGPAFAAVLERFGTRMLAADGSLDRAALADLVFSDAESLSALEAIVHPEVRREILTRLAALRDGAAAVVVLEIPLLVEASSRAEYGLDGVLVVDVPAETAIERLETKRLMDPGDARRRIANQAGRPERLAQADFVMMNLGSLDELEEMCARAWRWITSLESHGAP